MLCCLLGFCCFCWEDYCFIICFNFGLCVCSSINAFICFVLGYFVFESCFFSWAHDRGLMEIICILMVGVFWPYFFSSIAFMLGYLGTVAVMICYFLVWLGLFIGFAFVFCVWVCSWWWCLVVMSGCVLYSFFFGYFGFEFCCVCVFLVGCLGWFFGFFLRSCFSGFVFFFFHFCLVVR